MVRPRLSLGMGLRIKLIGRHPACGGQRQQIGIALARMQVDQTDLLPHAVARCERHQFHPVTKHPAHPPWQQGIADPSRHQDQTSSVT